MYQQWHNNSNVTLIEANWYGMFLYVCQKDGTERCKQHDCYELGQVRVNNVSQC